MIFLDTSYTFLYMIKRDIFTGIVLMIITSRNIILRTGRNVI